MISLTSSRNWLLGTHQIEFSGEVEIRPGSLSQIIDGVLTNVLYQLDTAKLPVELKDFKGRNAPDLLLPGPYSNAEKDELFRIHGECGVGGTEGEEIVLEPFEVYCYTPFLRFEGAASIVHGAEYHRTGALPAFVRLEDLGRAAPLRPTYLRFGLEHFALKQTFAMLGSNPAVMESILVDATETVLKFRLITEQKSRGVSDPFTALPPLTALSSVIQRALGLDLQREFSTRS